MFVTASCKVCNSLREKAVVATHLHVQAFGRKELARLRHDSALAEALEREVTAAATARAEAVTAYKLHMESHRAGEASALAGSAS